MKGWSTEGGDIHLSLFEATGLPHGPLQPLIESAMGAYRRLSVGAAGRARVLEVSRTFDDARWIVRIWLVLFGRDDFATVSKRHQQRSQRWDSLVGEVPLVDRVRSVGPVELMEVAGTNVLAKQRDAVILDAFYTSALFVADSMSANEMLGDFHPSQERAAEYARLTAAFRVRGRADVSERGPADLSDEFWAACGPLVEQYGIRAARDGFAGHLGADDYVRLKRRELHMLRDGALALDDAGETGEHEWTFTRLTVPHPCRPFLEYATAMRGVRSFEARVSSVVAGWAEVVKHVNQIKDWWDVTPETTRRLARHLGGGRAAAPKSLGRMGRRDPQNCPYTVRSSFDERSDVENGVGLGP
jgi:hypothetical protein